MNYRPTVDGSTLRAGSGNCIEAGKFGRDGWPFADFRRPKRLTVDDIV